MITADEFENQYAERAKISVDELRALGRVVRPCDCGEDGCEGWQSISQDRAAEYDDEMEKELISEKEKPTYPDTAPANNLVHYGPVPEMSLPDVSIVSPVQRVGADQ